MSDRSEEHCFRLQLQHTALFRYSGDLLLVVSRKGTIIEANQKAAALFQRDLAGARFPDLCGGQPLSMDSFASKEVVQTMHLRCSTRAGEQLSLLLTVVPLVYGETIGELLVIGRDLREKEGLERRVQELEKERGELLRKVEGGGPRAPEDTLQKLKAAMQQLEEVNRRFTRELEMASLLQHSLVPKSVEPNRYLRTAFYFRPIDLVGGDYYDVVELGDQRRGVFIADVSGHGITSAFIAAMLKISFHNCARAHLSPARVLYRLNREYCRVIQTGDYLTAFYAVFDPSEGKLTYCGAGHPDALLLKGDGRVVALGSEGFFIGMFEEAEYRDASAPFEEGDLCLVFTDGIVEAYSDRAESQYGMDRLREVMARSRDRGVKGLIDAVIADLEEFMGESSFYDDLAMVAVAYAGKGEEGEAEQNQENH
ncbi:MAG: PP2C family protein-serine/threonine phosphatase [Spirochaetota bacterium]